MKKRYFYLSIWILTAIVLSACSDFLDEEAKGSQVNKNYYISESDAVAATDAIYSYLISDADAYNLWSSHFGGLFFNDYWELRDIANVENSLRLIHENEWYLAQYQKNPDFINNPPFMSDHFWPIIFGQAGVLGTIIFLVILGLLMKRCMDVRKHDLHGFVGVLYVMAYLMISSVAEPAFHNAVAIPLALVLGMVFSNAGDEKHLQDSALICAQSRN